MRKKRKYKDRLNSLEKHDGVLLVESEVCTSLHIGIKDNSILLFSDKNGTFCMNAAVVPDVLKELAEIHNTYFADSKG